MDKIKLNFIPLSKQNHGFKVYRTPVDEGDTIKDEDDYRAKLPENGGNKWSLYDISLKPKKGYETYDCEYTSNGYLSEYYLFNILKKKLMDAWEDCEYQVPQNSKYKEITFIVASHTKGCTNIIIQPYFLKSENKIGFLFQHRFSLSPSENYDRQTQIESYSLDRAGRPNVFIYRDKQNLIQEFIKTKFKPFADRHSIEIDSSLIDLPAKRLSLKSYVVGRGQISQSQFMGVKNYGPYRLIDEKVKFLFLFSEKTRSLARDVYLGLIGKFFPGQFPGLSNMFKLPINKEIVDHHVIKAFDQKSLDDFGDLIVKIKKKQPGTKIMTIVVLPKGFKGVEGVFDAYGYLKFLALKHGVYSQVVTEDTFFRKDQLKWSISNIGLQTFCKLGGAPWLVKPAKSNCLILGIGSAHEKVEDKIKRFVAYTVCLDSSGDFKYIQPLSSSVNENEYLESLRSNLEVIIRKELEERYQSFVLHLPYKIKKSEINAIKKVVHTFREDSPCEVIVVKVNTKHRFLGFANHNTRVPYESSITQLSFNQFLLWAEGLQYGKEVLHKRVSEPLHIDFLEPPQSLESKWDCLQDILNLTGANWRGFNSKAQPISILYSKLIADFMKEFSHIDGCKDFTILRTVSVAPWFL